MAGLDMEFFAKISLYHGGHVERVVYYRRGMSIRYALRWRWWFEYLAAKVKVAHPRERVELLLGRTDLLSPAAYAEKKREDLLKAKCGQVSRLRNSPDELDLFDIAISKKQDRIRAIEEEIRRLEAGETTFWVPEVYVNHIKEVIEN